MKFEWYFYKNFYDIHECNHLLAMLDDYPATDLDIPAREVVKTAKVNTIEWRYAKHFFKTLEELAHHTNKQMFGYDLYAFTDHDMINYNTYHQDNNGEYGWHKDVELDKIYDIKLTVIANISTAPYTGGEFDLFMNGPVHVQQLDEPGTVLIFPSYFAHRVRPVISGTRKTISMWIQGPNFR